MRKAGGGIEACRSIEKIENLLEITKLHKVFDISRRPATQLLHFHSA